MKHKARDGYCIKHHPLFVPSRKQSSKISCEIIDKLALELDTPFQHVHYEEGLDNPIGVEYCHPNYPKKGIDGAFEYEDELVLFEFHGDYWHGHPSQHNKGTTERETTLKESFIETQRIMRKVVECTKMRLFYVWEFDYDRLEEDAPIWSIVREFNGILEW